MHIGSGLNTVSSMYRQQKGNNMKAPASGEKTFYTAETPKVYQIFTTDNMLWTGGNGTGLSYCLKYADDSTDENPVVLHLITKIQLLKIRSNKLLHHGKSIKLGALDNITREKNCKFIFYVNFHFCRAGIRPALDFIIIDKKILNIYAR